MTNPNNLKGRIQLVYQRSHILTKVVVLLALVLSMAAMVTLGVARQDAKARTAALQKQATQLEQENLRLERCIDELGTVQGIQRIATQELGLVNPGTVVFQPENISAD